LIASIETQSLRVLHGREQRLLEARYDIARRRLLSLNLARAKRRDEKAENEKLDYPIQKLDYPIQGMNSHAQRVAEDVFHARPSTKTMGAHSKTPKSAPRLGMPLELNRATITGGENEGHGIYKPKNRRILYSRLALA
jgi:hypothetical protein